MNKIGHTKLVEKYLGFLKKDYGMNYTVQIFAGTFGVDDPTYVYSYYNNFGCFSIVEIAQRNEWDFYISDQYSTILDLLLKEKIVQREYFTNYFYSLRKLLKVTAQFIQTEIKASNCFWGIRII